jgi:hypothetical protein
VCFGFLFPFLSPFPFLVFSVGFLLFGVVDLLVCHFVSFCGYCVEFGIDFCCIFVGVVDVGVGLVGVDVGVDLVGVDVGFGIVGVGVVGVGVVDVGFGVFGVGVVDVDVGVDVDVDAGVDFDIDVDADVDVDVGVGVGLSSNYPGGPLCCH